MTERIGHACRDCGRTLSMLVVPPRCGPCAEAFRASFAARGAIRQPSPPALIGARRP